MKYIKILLLVAFSLILTGCTTTGPVVEDNLAYKQGAKSVQIEIQPNTPPFTLFAEETYDLGIELRNIGAYPGDDDDLPVELYFIGFDESVIQLDTEDSIDIPGSASPTNPRGGIEFYEQEFDVELFEEASVLDQDIKVVACYPYETFQQIDVCVDPNPIDNDEDPCVQGVVSGLGGQGAPVGITSATLDSSRGKVRASMTISNLESIGTVYRDNECLNPRESDKDVVEVIEVFLGEDSMDCTPDEFVRIGTGGRLTCTLDGLDEERPAYKTTLSVQLEYNFKKSVERQVRVERIE